MFLSNKLYHITAMSGKHSWQALEVPTAFITFGLSILCLIWKSVGVAWIPVIGSAMVEFFKGTPENSYYPRRGTLSDGTPASDDAIYNLWYFAMYGLLSTANG